MIKRIFVSGNFNILHPGHLRLLRFAKSLGDELIVGVHSDKLGGSNVQVPENLRLEGLKANIWVDKTMIIEDVSEVIKELKPEIVVKGKEYENSSNPELETIEEYGGKLIFSSGEVIFSSLELIDKNLDRKTSLNLEKPLNFLKRKEIDPNDLKIILSKFSETRVCIIGDLIIDEYINCDPLGMSQEDPTIVVTPVETQKFIGGAGIVAAHASALGAKVSFISISGDDDASNYSQNYFKEMNIDTFIFTDENRPTTLKQRYRSKDKTLLRVSHLHQSAVNQEIQDQIFNKFNQIKNDIDVLIFSDFNYGCLPQELVDKITNIAKKENLITAADSQSSSQVGDISRFKDMHFLFPTEYEARISLRNNDDGLVVLADKLSSISKAKNIILKLGEEGILMYFNPEKSKRVETDRLKALNKNPKDVAGAGDSLLITTLLGLASGGSYWHASLLGSYAAAIQISRVGNSPLQLSDLINVIDEM
jgi:rfaE bifunctional protein kinase chain/domain